jgi:hypothetical protein
MVSPFNSLPSGNKLTKMNGMVCDKNFDSRPSLARFRSTCSGFGQFHHVTVWLRRDYSVVVKIFIFSKELNSFLDLLAFKAL